MINTILVDKGTLSVGGSCGFCSTETVKKPVDDNKPAGVSKIKKYSGVLPSGVYVKEVIYNYPATIVFFSDGTKVVSKCSSADVYSYETGLSICILKKILGSAPTRKLLTSWLPEQYSLVSTKVTLRDVIKREKEGK